MPQAERHAGFTLIEAALAIVIGMLAVGGAAVLYRQVREGAQNSAAREKLAAVATIIEEYEARDTVLPSLGQIQAAWKVKRPDDYNTSPWGGALALTGNNWIDGKDDVAPKAEIGDSPDGTRVAGTTPTDRGRIYYFRRDPYVPGSRYFWLSDLSVYDATDLNALYRMTDYGLAFVGPQAQQWYFVTGRGKTNAEGTRPNDLPAGEIGD